MDPLAERLKRLEAEQSWASLRRELKRHLRELPDSSLSRAKQKLMGSKITGTALDQVRLEHRRAKELQQSRDLERQVEEELRQCARQRATAARGPRADLEILSYYMLYTYNILQLITYYNWN